MKKLKWFKFLIYFGLWLSALINVVSAIMYFTGFMYEDASVIYSVYGNNLKTLDVIYGILLILLAALTIFARFRLVGFKSDGPKLLYAAIASSPVMTVGYAVAALVITGVNALLNIGNIVQIIFWLLLLLLNILYFQKRKNMFDK